MTDCHFLLRDLSKIGLGRQRFVVLTRNDDLKFSKMVRSITKLESRPVVTPSLL